MKLFSKKDQSSSVLAEKIRCNALRVIDDNILGRKSDSVRLKEARDEIRKNYPNIESGRAGLSDVVAFCREYGCKADFLLGLSDGIYI